MINRPFIVDELKINAIWCICCYHFRDCYSNVDQRDLCICCLYFRIFAICSCQKRMNAGILPLSLWSAINLSRGPSIHSPSPLAFTSCLTPWHCWNEKEEYNALMLKRSHTLLVGTVISRCCEGERKIRIGPAVIWRYVETKGGRRRPRLLRVAE